MNEPLLKEALSYEQVFTNNDEMYRKYQQREDAIREETTKIRLGEKRGEKRGIIIGRQQGITIGKKQGEREKAEAMAKEMLADKVDIKFIAKYTKLSIDEINALKMNM